MNEIFINLNDKLISMCDVSNMSCVTKQSIRFVCHPPFKSRSWHRPEIYDSVKASCYVGTWSVSAICQGMFRSFWLGCNSTQIICCVYLYGVHVQPVMMCVCVCARSSELLLQDQGKLNSVVLFDMA